VEKQEFEALIDSYGKTLFSFCRRLENYSDEANDLYQQTFMRAFELADRIDQENNPRAFLFSIAIGIHKNHARSFARHQRIAPREDITDENASILPDKTDIERDYLQEERERTVREAVKKLKDPYRTVVLLFYNGEMNIQEIARICKCPEGTVKSRLHKAKELIRKELEASDYVKNYK
jgi:RNA polymerase sigma-70 factor (ECF subfamily)